MCGPISLRKELWQCFKRLTLDCPARLGCPWGNVKPERQLAPRTKWKSFNLMMTSTMTIVSGQIIATSHDRFSPNGGLVREMPLFQGNLGWKSRFWIVSWTLEFPPSWSKKHRKKQLRAAWVAAKMKVGGVESHKFIGSFNGFYIS